LSDRRPKKVTSIVRIEENPDLRRKEQKGKEKTMVVINWGDLEIRRIAFKRVIPEMLPPSAMWGKSRNGARGGERDSNSS